MGELLRIEQLKIRFESEYGRTQAVRGASLHIDEGKRWPWWGGIWLRKVRHGAEHSGAAL